VASQLAPSVRVRSCEKHARFIVQRFDVNYPHYRREFARVITHSTEYVDDLIAKFSMVDKSPHIAVSVDMLDTGTTCPKW
jgi:type I restriction enzyme, R subunit